jgi:ferredoxin-NADP reductase
MLVKKYQSEVISIENPFEGIYTLEFFSKRGKYKFIPGQFLHIGIDEDYDGIGQWPDSRCFSMQNKPGSETIQITYAVKGSFTKQMEMNLKVGSEIWLKLPYGNLFTQSFSKENSVFIAGGTGITPFLSLFTHESFFEYLNPRIYLGFRSKEYNIYESELNNLCNSSKFIKYFYEDTEGIIDINSIISESNPSSYYFISGPPSMIKTFKQALIANGVKTENVLTDDWE